MIEQKVDISGLPCDAELERLVLGAALSAADAPQIVHDNLEVEAFALAKHQRIRGVIGDLLDEGVRVDRVTVAERLQRLGQLESVGGLSYIVSLDDGLPQIVAIEDYVERVRAISVARRAILTINRAVDDILGAQDVASVQRASEMLSALSAEADKRRTSGLAPIGEFLQSYEGGIDGFLAGDREPGVSSPWPSLNACLHGLERGTLTVIGASSGMGKSQMALQWAIHAARSGVNTAIFSLEMQTAELWRRAVALEYGDSPDAVRRNRVRTMAPIAALDALPVAISQEMSQTIGSLKANVRRANRRRQLGLVVVDYLQLIEARGTSRVEAVGAISRGLKMLAREAGAPVLALSQINREAEKEDEPPRLSALRESGSIGQDADNVVFLHQSKQHRGAMFDQRCPMPCELIVAKQRNGPVGAKIPMIWNYNLARLDEHPGKLS